jgi:hypothetical protein
VGADQAGDGIQQTREREAENYRDSNENVFVLSHAADAFKRPVYAVPS